jgi:NAD-dependent deacetylase
LSDIHAVSQAITVLTGAGISAESGIPTFRGEGGLWRSFRAEDLATPDAFSRDPELVWEWYDWRRGLIAACQPNRAHHTLAEIEEHVRSKSRRASFSLITQNIDGLHDLAGSKQLIELHGNIWRMRCTKDCQPPWQDRTVPLTEIPARCNRCGALARPDVVWFGESLPATALDRAFDAARHCTLMLVVGTSAVVQPAASLPVVALQHGAYLVEINPQPTPLSGIAGSVIRQPAAQALPEWWQAWSSNI